MQFEVEDELTGCDVPSWREQEFIGAGRSKGETATAQQCSEIQFDIAALRIEGDQVPVGMYVSAQASVGP